MDLTSTALIVAFVLNTGLGLFVLIQNIKKTQNIIFSILTLFISVWIFTNFAVVRNIQLHNAYLIASLGYFSALGIGYTFFYFCYTFPRKTFHLGFYRHLLVIFLFSLASVLAFSKTLTVQGVQLDPWRIETGPGATMVLGVFVAFILASFWVLIGKLRSRTVNVEERRQIQYVFVGTISSAVLGIIFNLILPLFFDNYVFVTIGPIFILIMLVAIAYSIVRHGLFNIKIVATEIFVGALWLFLLIRMLLAEDPQDRLVEGILLGLTIIVGTFLIRSVLKEVDAREHIEELAADLRSANTKLHKINMLKSEFVSVATHQLRSPLTAIRGYTSMLLEGGYGEVPGQMKEPLERVSRSTKSLTQVVQDFLDVSRIEQGRMQYDMAAFSLKELVQEVVDEQQPTIEKSDLDFSVSIENEEDDDEYIVRGDRLKLKQVVGNLVDNAVKYTEEGFVNVRLYRKNGTIRFEVQDSGMGINEKTLKSLFKKFNRADDADEVNVSGTGLGLYIAREIMDAHDGRVWAESDGPGKGSTFIVELKQNASS